MAHPQHAIPLVLIDGEVRPVVRAPLIERMSWALYDFSNTIFSMNVATLYFTVWLVSDLGVRTRWKRRPAPSPRRSSWCRSRFSARSRMSGAGATVGRVHNSRMHRLRDDRRVRSAPVALTGEAVIAPASVPAGWHASGPALFWVLAAFVLANFAYQRHSHSTTRASELVPVEERGRLRASDGG